MEACLPWTTRIPARHLTCLWQFGICQLAALNSSAATRWIKELPSICCMTPLLKGLSAEMKRLLHIVCNCLVTHLLFISVSLSCC